MSPFLVRTIAAAVLLFAWGGADVMAQFTISGTVTGPGGVPTANVDVFLFDDQGNPLGGTSIITDIIGFYSISGVPPATYGLLFEPPKVTGLLTKFVSPVVVSGNTTVNTSLILGNFLSGFVRDELGNGILNMDINVYDPIPDTVLLTPGDNTDATGYYQVLIPDGTFKIRWRATAGEKLVTVEMANVVITKDTTIDVTMLPGFYVSGFVGTPLTDPVFNADLDFIYSATGVLVPTPSDNTDMNGDFHVLIPHGTFDIQVEPLFTDGLVPREILSVPINNDTTINCTVPPGHVISGTVSGSARAPVANADIDLINTTTGIKLFTPQDNTNASGLYQLLAVSGLYDIVVKPPVASHLAPIVIDSISVNSATVVDATVPSGFLLSGTVRNRNLAAVSGVDIDAAVSSTGAKVFLTGDNTDAAGIFGVIMVGGTYHLDIEPPLTRRLTARQFKNLVISNDLFLGIVLDTGIIISGIVTDSIGAPVANVDVSAIVNSSGDTVFTPLDNTDLFGFYQILVPPDIYKLLYIPVPPATLNDTILLNSVSIAHDTIINVSFSSTQPSCCVGLRGDVNNDGINGNILDLNYLVNRIFRGGAPLVCPQEANLNADGVAGNILDLNYLINRIFRGGPPAAAC